MIQHLYLVVCRTVEDALAHVPGEAMDLEPAGPRSLPLPVRAQRAALLRADARPVQVLKQKVERVASVAEPKLFPDLNPTCRFIMDLDLDPFWI